MAITPFHLLDQSLTIQRPTVTQGTAGGISKTYATVLSDVKARCQPMSGAENVRYGRESNRRMWRVLVEGGRDIREIDRVQFTESTSTGTSKTRTLNIVEISPNQTGDVIMRVIGEETD